MSSEQSKEKNPLQKWLEFLQQESWQLELLISGFSIFLIAQSFGPLMNWLDYLKVNGSATSMSSMGMVTIFFLGALLFLLANLVIHVVLRGLWIGTIGLRYVSQDIDYDALRYTPKFTSYLRRKIGTYDQYIERLEKFCSTIFAFSFLMVFFLLSLMSFLAVMILVMQLCGWMVGGMEHLSFNAAETPWQKFWAYFRTVFSVSYLFFGIVYFIDFISLGFFKRKKWTTKWFYPIYLFFSFITFSFVYRPIYYNFIDNKYGRRFVLFAVPYMVAISWLGMSYMDPSDYFPGKYQNSYWRENEVYDDKRENKIIYTASIPSKILKGRFLDVFVAYRHNDHIVKKICPDLPNLNRAGFKSEIMNFHETPPNRDSLMNCLGQLYALQLNDSLMVDVEYRFYQHPNKGEVGLNTVLDTDFLPSGRHELKIEKYYLNIKKDSLYRGRYITIPFWKE